MTEELRLSGKYTAYRFAVSSDGLFAETEEPFIVLEKKNGQPVAVTDFHKYVHRPKDDEEYIEKLRAAANFLTFVIHHMDDYGINCISDITINTCLDYDSFFCPVEEVFYIREFIYIMANEGLLHNIAPGDMLR